jgi:putative oxidoreductase
VGPRAFCVDWEDNEGVPLQRLFSMFPNGWPGGGLLLLRLTNGTLLLHFCIACWLENAYRVAGAFLAIPAIIAVLLLVGLWTPIAGALSAAAEVPLFMQGTTDLRTLICLMTIGIAVSMLGPGAFSIDAALFGRHRLDLPDR